MPWDPSHRGVYVYVRIVTHGECEWSVAQYSSRGPLKEPRRDPDRSPTRVVLTVAEQFEGNRWAESCNPAPPALLHLALCRGLLDVWLSRVHRAAQLRRVHGDHSDDAPWFYGRSLATAYHMMRDGQATWGRVVVGTNGPILIAAIPSTTHSPLTWIQMAHVQAPRHPSQCAAS